MAASYAAIERALLKQARSDGDAYAAEKRRLAKAEADRYAAESEAAYAAGRDAYLRQMKASVRASAAKRNTAAVQAALTRRQIRLRMADRGLSGSGTEAAGLAGANAKKAAADAAVTEALRSESARVNGAIGREYRELRQKQAKKWQQLTAAAEQDILKHRAALEKAAYSRAASIARSDKARALWERSGR